MEVEMYVTYSSEVFVIMIFFWTVDKVATVFLIVITY